MMDVGCKIPECYGSGIAFRPMHVSSTGLAIRDEDAKPRMRSAEEGRFVAVGIGKQRRLLNLQCDKRRCEAVLAKRTSKQHLHQNRHVGGLGLVRSSGNETFRSQLANEDGGACASRPKIYQLAVVVIWLRHEATPQRTSHSISLLIRCYHQPTHRAWRPLFSFLCWRQTKSGIL